MLTIHQIPLLALLLSATTWSYPRVHLDQVSNPILGSNDSRPITEDGITNTLGDNQQNICYPAASEGC
ncbi:hypothetical protein PGT21_017274 [Puccinia graminis f. sp. tritici]|uniref:Uncharacterized protein n=1 Tax=Puccinia graminis f. sp. tritici TaxID=56615 RepID=A0A5B0M188_PUCGR|nr:hypothetical protein PGT21_017274 [Puccinia graminis f. sp. tritici]KAA1089812.1 hypothetical protein PGTUg99_016929 [Puccinia graminis f. sp. tritici]